MGIKVMWEYLCVNRKHVRILPSLSLHPKKKTKEKNRREDIFYTHYKNLVASLMQMKVQLSQIWDIDYSIFPKEWLHKAT